jgi:hypothetical protein
MCATIHRNRGFTSALASAKSGASVEFSSSASAHEWTFTRVERFRRHLGRRRIAAAIDEVLEVELVVALGGQPEIRPPGQLPDAVQAPDLEPAVVMVDNVRVVVILDARPSSRSTRRRSARSARMSRANPMSCHSAEPTSFPTRTRNSATSRFALCT